MDIEQQEEGKPEQEVEAVVKRMEAIFQNPNITKVYANSFKTGYSISDVYVILERNGQPDAVLNMSYTCAKSLQLSLGRVIAELEHQTKHSIMVIGDIKP